MIRIKVLRFIFLAIWLLYAVGEADCAIYYVAPNGNDGNIGTNAAPWATFAKAMTVLQPGDTLYLQNGTYIEPMNIRVSGTSDNVIYFKAQNEGSAIVSTTYPASALSMGGISYVEVDGINFRNSGVYDPDIYCSTDWKQYAHVHGINIWSSDHITLRRITINGSSGCNSANVSLVNTTNSLLEDIAASGQGYVNLNLLQVNGVTVRRCWLNWTGPSTGGGDTPGVNQIYDSSNVLMENCYATSTQSLVAVGGMGTWAHYSSTSGNRLVGNIMFMPTAYAIGAFSDIAECGYTSSGTIIRNNVALALADGATATEVNADYNNGTSFSNNTFVGNNGSSSRGVLLSYRSSCTSQHAATASAYNNSLMNLTDGFQTTESDNYLKAYDYNNLYNVSFATDDPLGNRITDPSPSHEKKINPAYNTATYGYGAYLMVPDGLKGQGQQGADIGATILYEYQEGTTTNAALWPWPMEDRIKSEFGVSPTWEAQGGLWKSLNGVYAVFADHAGGGQYTDKSGVVYQADADYSGGATFSTTAAITGTVDSALYQSQRYGNFSYNIPLANGNYTVTLKFSEIYWNAVGQRIFDVSMQNQTVISNLDIFANVGKNAAYDVSVPVSVSNGLLSINFTSIVDNATVSAVVVSKAQSQVTTSNDVVFADHTGVGKYTDKSGIVYQADTDYSGGATFSTTAAITGTVDSALYQSQRYGNFSYNIPLANGNYTVTLKFAEIYWNAVGQRIFNVSMQGQTVISNLDIFANVGMNAAYDVSVPVSVTNGLLSINFRSIVDNATVGAIVVQTASYAGNPPSIQLNPASLSFVAGEGTNPSSQSLDLSNAGGGTLNWSAVVDSTTPAWLSIDQNNGANNSTINVSVNSASLLPGQYSKNITISAAGATNTPQTVNVTLTVNPSAENAVVFADHAGGSQYTDQSGVIYQADTYYSGGATASTSAVITGTADGSLYQSVRYGNFSYNIPLVNGNYTVTLKFAEIYWTAVGQRVFNVSLQGQTVLSNLDIFANVGKNAAYDVSIPVSVTAGVLNINLTSNVDAACLSAIVVRAASFSGTPTVIQLNPASLSFRALQGTNPSGQTVSLSNIGGGTMDWTAIADSTAPSWLSVDKSNGVNNATLAVTVNSSTLLPGHYSKIISVSAPGATNSPQTVNVTLVVDPQGTVFADHAGGGRYTDQVGVVYQADTDYTGGATALTAAAITGTVDAPLYQSVRYGNFSYNVPLANGNYTVTLKFAEIYWNSAGRRIFDVSMQGQKVLSNVDIFANVGKNAAYDVSIPVSVTSGTLSINFTSIIDAACLSAFEVTSSSSQ